MHAARRLLGAQRREALHRQRLAGGRAHDVRPRRGRRQGPPHRADPREGNGGLRGRRALRHDGPARQRPAPPLLQRRPRARRERARRARRGLPDRDARSSTTAASASAPARSAAPRSCSTWRSSTSRSARSSARRWPTSSSSRRRSAGWSPTCSGSSRWLPDRGPGRRRRARLLARVGDLQGRRRPSSSGTGQPRAAARRRRGLHARPSPTRRSCATSGSSRSSRAPTT